jgi:predicted phage terminase large subunit-like protein
MTEVKKPTVLAPQPGQQTAFLSSKADIAIYGGAAGAGKSFALLLEPLRHFNNPKFGGVIFRRNSVQVRNQGGLWDESAQIYTQLKAVPRQSYLEWLFPAGGKLKFAHLETEANVYDWQGSQIPYIGFDEVTHFTEKQFFYMLSRNRSMSGIPGYVRATCNPDTDSWVRRFIDWWIDGDGYPIQERSGILRYFIRVEDEIMWGATREELMEKYGDDQLPKSVTFIPAKIFDNKLLLEKDPSYLSSLKALSRVERMRLLEGNWNVKSSAGLYFQRGWFPIVDALPANPILTVRYWDRAATKPSETNRDPDYTVGLKLHRYADGTFIVSHVARTRDTPLNVERFVRNTATQDGFNTIVCVEQDPGSAGVADVDNYVRLLAGFNIRIRKPSKDKVTRALPVSAQCEHGNIRILRGEWNDSFLNELENFPDASHDDQVDALSGAFNELATGFSILDVL